MNDTGSSRSSGSNLPATVADCAVAVLPYPCGSTSRRLTMSGWEMARVYRDMRAGRIDTADGTKLAYVLAQLGKLIEAGEGEAASGARGRLTLRKVTNK